MDEADLHKSRLLVEDPGVSDGISIDEDVSPSLQNDLESDARDFEAPTWSLAVDQQFVKTYSKEAIKRQDVIHELVQTEINHVRTLKVMLYVYVNALRKSQIMDESQLERLFPRLDRLLREHQRFLNRLKQRRRESLEPGSQQNYCIHQIGDLLISQFSEESGKRLQDSYGVFCSRHTEAVNLYKDLLQNNKKFQSLIRKIGQLAIVKRLGVPEGILLVTQRITKYPVLVERIIKNTEVGSEEHHNLVSALECIKETISRVDAHVHQYEQLRELAAKLESKSLGRTSNGKVFRRDDLIQEERKVLREGLLSWRAQNRSKDIHVVLLPDLLLLLQEKDQKYVFPSLDGKPVVLDLQKLLVREAAHDEKVMYLISSTDENANLYEFHTSSGEERTSWRQEIWQAIENCPHEEEENGMQPEENEEFFSEKIKNVQEGLYIRDAQIIQVLEAKLELYAELKKGMDGPAPPRRLLVTGSASELLQGEPLLNAAIADAEHLQTLLALGERDLLGPVAERANVGQLPRRADTIAGYERTPSAFLKGGDGSQGSLRNRSQRPNSDPQLRDLYLDNLELSADDDDIIPAWISPQPAPFPISETSSTAASLLQKLYRLKGLVAQQDSELELLRAAERERPSRQRGNLLLEQEKQRRMEKQREELVQQQRLHAQMKQEQAVWEQERQRHQQEQQALEQELKRRQEECAREEARLDTEREELSSSRKEYQRDLERLRESARNVEKAREKLEQQNKQKKNINPTGTLKLEPTQILQYPTEVDLIPSPKPHVRPSLAPTTGAAFQERPPQVPPRKESISISPTKPDVPIQLVSTTNQALKSSSVQQQIPTKLAAHSKGKGGKGKSSHHRTSSAANIQISEGIMPIKATGKEGGSLKAYKNTSSRHISPDLYIPPDQPMNLKPPRSSTSMRKPNHSSGQNLHVHHKDKPKDKEDIFYF